MATGTLQHAYARPAFSRWILVGLVAGAVSVLVFHQGAWALLYAIDMTARAPFPLQPTRPLGVPVLWSLAFWGGIWGALLAAALPRMRGGRLLAAATLFGAVLPTLVAWFVVAPIKGQPLAAGWVPSAMLFGLIVNAAWGFGTGLGLELWGRRRGVQSSR